MNLYEGKEKYIFISYCHKNIDKVLPVINKLLRDGYRVWYDEGIEVGLEWTEIVATHLMDCGLFLAFISREYLDSFNCKREVDYAVSKRKSFIAVRLDDAVMSPGVEMQLSGVQFLNKYQMEEDIFYEKLYLSDLVKPCHEETVTKSEKAVSTSKADDPGELKQDEGADGINQIPKTEKEIPKKPVNKEKKQSLKKSALIVCAVLAAGAILILAGRLLSKVTIAGTTYSTNEEFVTIKDAALTSKDTAKLTRFTNLGLLSFENCDFTGDSEENLSKIKNGVRSFHVIDCTGIDNYYWLRDIESIQWIEIRNSGFEDDDVMWSLFTGMKGLKGIDLTDNKDFSNLGGLVDSLRTKIVELKVPGTSVTTLSPIRDLTSLQVLDIEDCKVVSLEPIENLEYLLNVNVSGNNIGSLKGLDNAVRMESLQASGCGLESIYEIRNCTTLKEVDLSGNNISDISPLEKSRVTIQYINLDDNNIEDMSSLKNLYELKELSADNNDIEDISFVKEADDLRYLSLQHNKIKNIDVLTDNPSIYSLYLSDNEIEGHVKFGASFSEHTTAEYSTDGGNGWDIQLQHNKITSLEFEGTGPSKLAIYDNPIEVITGLGATQESGNAEEPETTQATFISSDGTVTVIDDFVEPQLREGSLSAVSDLYISFKENSDSFMESLSSFNEYTNVHMSGCSMDDHYQIEQVIKNISYMTDKDMDAITQEERNEEMGFYGF